MAGSESLKSWARAHPEAVVFAAALLVLAATSADRLLRQSQGPHFVYQAEAFLHGQLHLTVPPPNDNDWIHHQGKVYVCFPPVPAVLMMPLVAIWGLGFNDVLFTLPFAALNVMLMFMVLERLSRAGLTRLGRRENLWLTVLFGFGTVNYSCSVLGEVWFTAHVVGLTFTLAYILATLDRRPLWAGAALALAFDTRVPLAFTALFFGLLLVFPRGPDGRPAAGSWRRVIYQGMLFSLPILVVGGLQMAMNQARFGNPFEFGHSYLAGPAGERIKAHGLFAYHYLWWNLSTMLCGLPKLLDHPPYLAYDPNGMSIFITTPVLLWLLWPRRRGWFWRVCWATAAAGLLPALFYQNSGYVQFGYRFALDVMPYLVMILAAGDLAIDRRIKVLTVVSVAVNLAGAISFKRSGPI